MQTEVPGPAKTPLSCHYLGERKRPQSAIILLHGLGADASDLMSFARLLPFTQDGKTLLVFPQAPLLPVTICQGALMPAWFDIYTFEKDGEQDHRGLLHTCEAVRAIIAELQENDVPIGRIVLGGFSQGGAVALHCATHGTEAIAGAAGFSAYLPPTKEPLPSTSPRLPIFMSHGIYDEIISLEISRLSRDRLRSASHTVFFQTYPVGHSLDKDVATDFSRWCARLLDHGTLDKSSFTS